MNKHRSNFIYVAKTDLHGFALKRNYIKNELLYQFEDEMNEIKGQSRAFYLKKLYKPMILARQKYI